MKKLLVATQNQGKQREFALLLSGCGFEVVFPKDIDQVKDLDVNESGNTICQNSLLKAQAFANASGLITVADDSCLEVDSLDGAPGVHSKRFFKGSGSARNQQIIKQLTIDVSSRGAVFKACLCLVDPNKQHYSVQYFNGELKGSISKQELGSEGFDYDRIFIPTGKSQTLAQLGVSYKNKISHRTQAMNKLKKYLVTNYA